MIKYYIRGQIDMAKPNIEEKSKHRYLYRNVNNDINCRYSNVKLGPIPFSPPHTLQCNVMHHSMENFLLALQTCFVVCSSEMNV